MVPAALLRAMPSVLQRLRLFVVASSLVKTTRLDDRLTKLARIEPSGSGVSVFSGVMFLSILVSLLVPSLIQSSFPSTPLSALKTTRLEMVGAAAGVVLMMMGVMFAMFGESGPVLISFTSTVPASSNVPSLVYSSRPSLVVLATKKRVPRVPLAPVVGPETTRLAGSEPVAPSCRSFTMTWAFFTPLVRKSSRPTGSVPLVPSVLVPLALK